MTGAEVSSVSGNTGVNSRSPCSLARSRMASIHSSLSRILHSRPSHQVFRIYLTPSRSVTDNAPSFVASNRSAGTVPRSSQVLQDLLLQTQLFLASCIFLEDQAALLCIAQNRSPSFSGTQYFYLILLQQCHCSVIHLQSLLRYVLNRFPVPTLSYEESL